MDNPLETYKKSDNNTNPNATSHYKLMTVGIVIGLVGSLLRFTSTWQFIDIASNIILVIGVIICFKAVFDILK